MQIYISRNNQRFGPYSEGEINRQISTGVVSHSDLAWHEGLPEWRPLGSIFGPSNVPPPLPHSYPPPPQVEYGSSSFGAGRWSPGDMTALVIFSVILPIVGIIFGIIGLCNRQKRDQGGILLGVAAGMLIFWAAIAQGAASPPQNQTAEIHIPPPRDEYKLTGRQPY